MAFFALLWKARTIEKYRLNYEKEKINSIVMRNTQMEQTLSQRWRYYRYDTQKRISRTFKKWYPEGSGVANFFLYLSTDQTFPNFLLKSVMGFVGGIVLTYLCFMFFVFQLSISLIHATIMSSTIGVLLTLGLAFSYRIRCLVFLLIPQFFSRVGRYTLTCYALVLILTGPATNTLKNSEVLSESMACSQEQLKTSVHQLDDLMNKPYNSMKESITMMMDRFKAITMQVKLMIIRLNRLLFSIVGLTQSTFSWLQSISDMCNLKLSSPYDRCNNLLNTKFTGREKLLGPNVTKLLDMAHLAQTVCDTVKPYDVFCYATDFMDEGILASIRKKIRNFTSQLRTLFHVEMSFHHSYSFSSNSTKSASQVAAGIVTEIRNRADPLLTWLSWSSCVTSLFLLLIIFRAKYYQHMYETRSRFDNQYVTKELRELDLKRQRQGRETVLPLNRRERAKYITTTSFRLVASEKVYLTRSAVFMAITTFKLLIHMIADYSLYWVLMTIRHHGKYQSNLMPGVPQTGAYVTGDGFVARLFRSILDTLDLPLSRPAPSPIPCLPDPYPPDFRRYTQIGVLIFMLWFFALFEPYGLRLRHLIMGQYRPERAKARATWLYNHILRTRGGFMKFARRKLHREYKYYTDSSLTFSHWLDEHIPYMLGIGSKEPQCLLCGTTTNPTDDDTRLTRCKTPNCPGVYCATCFSDIGQLCTICLSPADYGDQSDESLEKGSSDDSDSGSEFQGTVNAVGNIRLIERHNTDISATKNRNSVKRWKFFRRCFKTDPKDSEVSIPTDYEDLNMITDIKSKVNNHKRSAKEMLEKVPSSISFDYNNNQINNLAKLSEGIVCKTKSVGTNTDKRHQWFPKITFERFFTCLTIKIYKMHQNTPIKQNKAVLEQQLKNLRMDKANVTLDHNNRNVNKTRSNYSLPNPVIDSNEVNDDKIKTCKRDNGVTTTARRLQNSNQRNSTSNNKKDKSNKKSKKRKLEKIEPLDNSTPKENATNKRVTKNNQHKKSGKEKKKKVKMKTSRQKLNEYQTFFSRHWKSIKCNIGRTNRKTKSDSVILKEKKNHKRRKKWKDDISLAEVTPKESKCNNDNKKIRNYRISAFLADLDWMKKDFKKPSRQIIEDDTDDFSNLTKSKVCQMLPKHRNKIVAMMQFSNTPFQWGRPQELRYCKCYKQKCMESTYKVYQYKDSAKRALERFRHKVNSAIITPPSSMMHKMLSTMNLIKKPANKENNAANFPEQPEMSSSLERKIRKPGFIRTDVIYKNQDFLDELKMREANREDSDSSIQKIINPDATLLRTDCTLFHSISSERTENKVFFARGCKCEPFVDTQRKWTDVNKSVLPSTTKRPPPKKAQIQPKNMASKKRNTIVIKENDSNLLTRMRNYLSFSSCNNKSCQIKIERAKKAEKSKLYDEHMSNHDIPKPKAKQATTTKPKTNKEQTSKKDKDIDLCLDKCLSPKEPRPFNRSKCKEIEMAKIKEIQRHIDREREIKNEIIKEQERHKEREKQIERELGLELMRHRQHERHLLGDEDNQTLNSLAKCCDFTPKDTKSPPQQGQSQLPPSHQQPQQPLPYQPSMYQPPPQPPPAPPIKVRDCATQDSSSKMMRRKKEKNAGVGTGVTCMCDKKEGRDRRTSCTCATQYTPCMKISAATMPDKYIEKVISKCTRRHSPPITRIVSETSAHKAIDRKSPRVKHSGIQFQSSNIHNEHSPGIICPSNYRKEKTLFAKRTSNYKKEVTSTATCSPRIKDTSTLTNFLPKLDITSNPPLSSPVASPQDRGELESLISPSLIRLNMADTTTEQLMIPKVGTSGFAKVSSKKCQVEAKEKHKLSKDERKDKNRAENQTEHKAAHNFYWQKYGKKNKADTKPCPVRRRRLSLERSLFEICHQSDAILTSMQSESSTSTITSHSDDETRTDTTICSLATVEFEELRRRTRKKRFPNVVTRINQATSTDKARSRNVATETQDWWSPMVEKKGEIALNKKKGYYVCEKRRRDMRDFTEKGKTRDSGVTTEGRIVKFNSRTQVIPPGLLGYSNDIMSPARYLLESQKYYNELFAFNLRPPVADYAYYQAPRIQDKEKSRSAFGSRRAHQHKTKRLDECYTPRRQYSPRKRQTDSTRTSDSPRRRSNMYRKSMNRYYTKVNSGKRYYY